jgi:tetratricopeptide (TPR) repeat protein
VRLLGCVQVDGPAGRVGRWPSRACAALLARLALQPQRAHPREELIEALWPGVAPDTGRARLRQTLSTLRGLLEGASGAMPGVLVADRQTVRVNAGALDCDVLRFTQCARAGEPVAARSLYAGELMPGFYDEWIVDERNRLAALFEGLPPAAPSGPPTAVGAAGVPTVPAAAAGPSASGATPASARPVPAVPAAPLAGRLPAYWTRAFGQDAALSELCESVRTHRLLSVVGPGGNGKTRLAVAAAQALGAAAASPAPVQAPDEGAASTPGPAFERIVFAPMLDVVQAQQLWPALGLLLAATGRGDARSQVVALLARQPTLLVLDNVEQFDDDSAQALSALLQDVPGLHLLLTSRRRLGLAGEQVFDLPGLPLPPLPPAQGGPGDPTGAGPAPAVDEALARNPAVSLFVDRARESRPEFRLSAQTAPAVVGLVHLLGGMPLAIELAASRLRALGPRELLERLSQDAGTPLLDLLARPGAASGKLSALSRHASMRHVMAWSWQQLSPELASLLQAMSIFAQPASPALIAQAWAGWQDPDAGAQPPDPATHDDDARAVRVQALLADALEASLVTRSTAAQDDEPARYMLLQPVREFAAERSSARQALGARTRLRRWLIGFARACAARRHEAIADVQAELPQMCAAILQGVADGAPDEAAQLAVALRRHWEIDTRAAPPTAVVQALRQAQPQLGDPALRCQTSLLLCISLLLGGEVEAARGYADQALALAPDARLRAQALMRQGLLQLYAKTPGPALAELADEAIALARQAGAVETEAIATRLHFLRLCNQDRDYLRAETYAQHEQALWESLGHRRNAYQSLMDRTSCWTQRGLFEQAVEPLARCEQVAREEDFATGYIMSSWQLGRALMKLHRGPEALAAFQRCVRDAWQHQRMAYVADALVLAPGGLVLTGRHEQAARLQGFAAAHWQRHFGPFYREISRDVCFTRRVLRQALGPTRLEQLRLQGSGLSLSQAVALALAGSAAG